MRIEMSACGSLLQCLGNIFCVFVSRSILMGSPCSGNTVARHSISRLLSEVNSTEILKINPSLSSLELLRNTTRSRCRGGLIPAAGATDYDLELLKIRSNCSPILQIKTAFL